MGLKCIGLILYRLDSNIGEITQKTSSLYMWCWNIRTTAEELEGNVSGKRSIMSGRKQEGSTLNMWYCNIRTTAKELKRND